MNIKRTLSTVATEAALAGAIGLAHAQTPAPANSATPTTPSADAARALIPGSPSATSPVAPSMPSVNTDISTSNNRMNDRMTNSNVPVSGTTTDSNITAGLAPETADAAPIGGARPVHSTDRAEFNEIVPPAPAKWTADWTADWAAASPDHPGRHFAGLNERGAALYVLGGSARLTRASMVSLDSAGDNVVWLDYAAAVELRSVEIIDPLERRLERIATSYASEKRVSNGCVNVPVAFFDAVATPALGHARGILYVSSALKRLRQVFPAGAI